MVNSTSITAKMTNSDDVKKYYEIFINTMATIARNFEGKVIKKKVELFTWEKLDYVNKVKKAFGIK